MPRKGKAHPAKLAVAVALLLAGCGSSEGGGGDPEIGDAARSTPLTSPMTISTPAFEDGGEIPDAQTCDGADTSPELVFDGVPAEADSLRLEVEDPDAPTGTFVHWLVIDIPPGTTTVPAGEVPEGGIEAENDFDRTQYGGPCPREGDEPHRYVFRLIALDDSGEPLATAELEGFYGR